MTDEFREFVELPALAPTQAEEEGESVREREVVDRKGRIWHVTPCQSREGVSDGAGGDPGAPEGDGAAEGDGPSGVELRFVHHGLEIRAPGAPENWARLPTSKLLELAGLD